MALRLLFVATKAPVPARDGGRVLMLHTLRALADAGHAVTLVAPVDPARDDAARAAAELRAFCDPVLVPAPPRSLAQALRDGLRERVPFPIARHVQPAVRAAVEAVLSRSRVDVVHAEQLQALAQCPPGRPVVLRCQNVESDLWQGSAAQTPLRSLARGALGAFAAWEGRAVAGSAAAVALTAEDAARLRLLAGPAARLEVVRAPFPAELPAAEAPLPGQPALVLSGSAGWRPNRDGARWFVREVWPAVRRAAPAALLHLFGEALRAPGVVAHPRPADSRGCFPPGALAVVPLRVASGVRIRVLEAWARGLPVLATPAAAAGLEGAEDALVACADAAAFANGVARLRDEPSRRAALVQAGRDVLRSRHDPAHVAAELGRVYEAALRR